MLIPRYYQEEAVVGIFSHFATKQTNPIVALPTGTGKALVIAEFLRRALHYYPGTRILCVTHVKELVAQNHAELLTIWPTAPAGIFSAGLKRKDTHLPITFCGIASIHKALEWFGRIDLVVIDECHMISDRGESMYAKVLGELLTVNPFLKVVGLTATPFRLGTGMLTEGKIFSDICCDYTGLEKFNQLVDQGYICPLIPKRTKTELDVSGVAIEQGEFVQEALQAAVDKESITRAALQETFQLAAWTRKHWLVFTTGVLHADHTRDILLEMGISAVSVHSALPGGDAERDKNIAAFKAGQVQAMVGVGVFTTGFNFPAIDCIVVLRPTMSPVLWVQLLGRGTRPFPGKTDCLVLDFAANTRRLGPINDPVIPKRKNKNKTGFVPYKICPVCDTYCHTRARFCPSCQHEFPETFAADVKADTEELIRKEKPPRNLRDHEVQDTTPAVVAEYPVQRVEYAKHFAKDPTKPPSLRATYYCGSRVFNEWLCFEHSGFALHKARDAWRLMGGGDAPTSVDTALAEVSLLQPPSMLRVLMKGKWPEVVGYEFGTPGQELPTAHAMDDGGGEIPNADDPGRHNGVGMVPHADDDIPF